jgi:hypothetical protein
MIGYDMSTSLISLACSATARTVGRSWSASNQ